MPEGPHAVLRAQVIFTISKSEILSTTKQSTQRDNLHLGTKRANGADDYPTPRNGKTPAGRGARLETLTIKRGRAEAFSDKPDRSKN